MHGNKLKEVGNHYYKAGQLARAEKFYKEGTQLWRSKQALDDIKEEEDRNGAKQLYVAIRLNLAALRLKEKDYQKVINNCNKVSLCCHAARCGRSVAGAGAGS